MKSISPKLRDMHKLGAETCDPEFRDALLLASNEIDWLREALDSIGAMFYVDKNGIVLLKRGFVDSDVLDVVNSALEGKSDAFN